MRICVDENIPLMTVGELRRIGHDVLDIRGTLDQGIADDVLWAMIRQGNRLLITTDKGFVQYRDERHDGILVIRLRQPNANKIHQRSSRVGESIFSTPRRGKPSPWKRHKQFPALAETLWARACGRRF